MPFTISLRFEPRDLWVGVYWTREFEQSGAYVSTFVYVCIIPMLPLRFAWTRRVGQ